jgi:site-specific recombinase XerD
MPYSLDQAVADYTLYALAKGYSQKTINDQLSNVRAFCHFLNCRDLTMVNAEDLQRYIVHLREKKVWDEKKGRIQDRPLSATSVNSYFRSIRSFWNYLLSAGKIPVNPLSGVSAPKLPKVLPKVLTEDELRLVVKTVSDNILEKTIIFVLLDSGVRLSGLIGMTVDTFDLTNLRGKVTEKGNKERFVYISDISAAAITEYLSWRKNTGCLGQELWVSKEGKPLTSKRVQDILGDIGNRSGLKFRLSPHKLRHTYATLALKNGLNVEYLRRNMGHDNMETTMSYVNAVDDDVARASREASPLVYLFHQGSDSKNGNLPEKQTVTRQMPYQETAHKHLIRELANSLAQNITLPSLWDKELLRDLPIDFEPGKYYLPIGTLEIGKHKEIKVIYPDFGTGIAKPHLVSGLYSHLSTSGLAGYPELVGDKGKIPSLKYAFENYSQLVMGFLKVIIDDIKNYGAAILFSDETKPGLTRWFIVTVWKDAIDKACGYSWIDNSWYTPPENIPNTSLNRLRCGGYFIGIAKTTKTLKTYENWHKTLRTKYGKHSMAQNISVIYRELSEAIELITQRLQQFSDLEYLPGYCKLC